MTMKVDRPARCQMETDHGVDELADWCDTGSFMYACEARLTRVVDFHPNEATRKRAAGELDLRRRRRNEAEGVRS